MFDVYTERSSRARLMYGAAVVLAIVGAAALIENACQTAEDAEGIIHRSPSLQSLDYFCSNIPRPEDFSLRFRAVGGNAYTRQLSYFYSSDRPFSLVVDFYQSRLPNEGWTMTSLYTEDMTARSKEISFSRDDYRISIATAAFKAKYSLTCSQKIR